MIKFYGNAVRGDIFRQQTFKVVKLAIVLILTGVLQANARAYSPTIFNIRASNSTVRQMFKQIENTSKYVVFYRLEEVNENKKVDVVAKDATIEEVMKQVLYNQALIFELANDTIFVRPEYEERKAAFNVTGHVTDATGVSLSGVSIKLRGSSIGVSSDANGKYSITIPDASGELEFSSVGFVFQT